jgi:hypothetical protein
MWARTFAWLFATGCIAQVQSAINPTPSGSGMLTCRQIVEQCDTGCQDPLCVRRCGDQGTPEAAQQHAVLVDCAQRSGCTDLDCIRASCPTESTTCEGSPPPPPPAAPAQAAPR